ncbi:hypothetical protein T484DRAFT_1954564, partial [Baffinella frigidus]
TQSPGFQTTVPGAAARCGAVWGRLGPRSRVGWWERTARALCRVLTAPMEKDPRGSTDF